MYYGAYISSNKKNTKYLDDAIKAINTAIGYYPDDPSFYYNKAIILQNTNVLQAESAIEKCLSLLKEDNDDYLALAYKLYLKTNNSTAPEIMKRLEKVNPHLAYMTKKDPKI